MILRFTSTLTGSCQSPPEISSTASASTSPSFTTSVRQLCTIILSYGMSGNITFHCASDTGTCVPRAGMTSTSAPLAASSLQYAHVMKPAFEW